MEAIVLLSGGQDSTTCLYWAKKNFGPGLRTVAFDYGQRHKVELECAEKISLNAGTLSHAVLEVPALKQIGGAALTDDSVGVEAEASSQSGNKYAHAHGLPSTFVPGRNMLFLTLAAAYGARFGVYDLVTGVCEADAAGYPDCREAFISAASGALTEALDEEIRIYTPLIDLNKSQTWSLADKLGVVDVIIEDTHTCYDGDHTTKHLWGYGCGECPACSERQRGFDAYRVLAGATP